MSIVSVKANRPTIVDDLERWLAGTKFSVFLTANFSLALLRHARANYGEGRSGESYRINFLCLKEMFESIAGATFEKFYYFSSYRPSEGNDSPPELKLLSLLDKNGFIVKRRKMTLGERDGHVKKISPRFTVDLTTAVRERVAAGDNAVVILDTNRDVGDLVESLANENKRVIVGDISGLNAFIPMDLGRHAHFKFDMANGALMDWLRLET